MYFLIACLIIIVYNNQNFSKVVLKLLFFECKSCVNFLCIQFKYFWNIWFSFVPFSFVTLCRGIKFPDYLFLGVEVELKPNSTSMNIIIYLKWGLYCKMLVCTVGITDLSEVTTICSLNELPNSDVEALKNSPFQGRIFHEYHGKK